MDVGWDLSKYLLPEAKASYNCYYTDRVPVSSLTIKQPRGRRPFRKHSKKSTSVHEYERDLYLCMPIQYHTFTPLTCACSSDPLEPDPGLNVPTLVSSLHGKDNLNMDSSFHADAVPVRRVV